VTRYVAFLRGLNVGGHTVKMDALRRHFEALDLAAVSTFIASGNVLFESDEDASALELRVETALKAALGYEVATFLRTDREIGALAAYEPFPEVVRREDDRQYVLFLKGPPDEGTHGRYLALGNERDLVHVYGRELHWVSRGPSHESTIKESDWSRAGAKAPTTSRNVNTVRRLAAKLGVA
jgi:uncharacterized protein (DUF1697 family)